MDNNIFQIFPIESFIDLSMYQYGYEQCSPGHSFGPAARNHYLFHYVISGMGTLMANDAKGVSRTYHIKRPDQYLYRRPESPLGVHLD